MRDLRGRWWYPGAPPRRMLVFLMLKMLLLILGLAISLRAESFFTADFERTTFLPEGWAIYDPGAIGLTADIDQAKPRSGRASLRLSTTGRPAKDGAANVRLLVIPGQQISVSASIRGASVKPGSLGGLAVLSVDTWGKLVDWVALGDRNWIEQETWTKIEGRASIAPGADAVFLQLFIKGEGQLWLDEVAVSRIAPGGGDRSGAPPAAAVAEVHELNGSFERGGFVPDAWSFGQNADQRLLKLGFDTQVKADGKRSLRLDLKSGLISEPSLVHDLPATMIGREITISGSLRSSPRIAGKPMRCTVGIVAQDAEFRDAWHAFLERLPDTPREWLRFEQTKRISGPAVKLILIIQSGGEGTLWFDDFQVKVR